MTHNEFKPVYKTTSPCVTHCAVPTICEPVQPEGSRLTAHRPKGRGTIHQWKDNSWKEERLLCLVSPSKVSNSQETIGRLFQIHLLKEVFLGAMEIGTEARAPVGNSHSQQHDARTSRIC